MALVAVIDLSKWQDPNRVPYETFKEHGVLLVIIKSSMGGGVDSFADEHVAMCKKHGLKFAFYHWVDPTQSWERQADHFIGMIRKHNPDFISYDVEHWWDDWAEYEAGSATFPEDDVGIVAVIGSFVAVYQKVTRETNFPYDRQFVYSADWFVDLYGEALIQAIRDFPGRKWWADYTQVWLTDWKITWETFEYLWTEYLSELSPIVPAEDLEWDLWQVQSRIWLPPWVMNIDLNICSPELAAFILSLYDEEPPPDPDPDPDPDPPDALKRVRVSTSHGLNVRMGPNINNPKAGPALSQGTEVYIYEIIGTWGRIEGNNCNWVHLGYTQDVV